jgi:hypothetical protein
METTSKSRCSGPNVGVTAVVKNSFAAPCGRKRRNRACKKPPRTNPDASTPK